LSWAETDAEYLAPNLSELTTRLCSEVEAIAVPTQLEQFGTVELD